ncbi:MAG: hypothetical protein JSS57_17445 [Proteobacteria bacterium]|nr:hypothetical protein [Pseudomonadota bacterium]
MGEQPANAVKAAEEKLHDEQLDWEDFCADKAELEEPVDESDRWVNIQRWVIEDLLDAARTEGRGDQEPVAWQEAAEPFFRLAREVINPVNGERPWHADSKDWMVVFSFAGQSVTLGDLRRAAVASPIREPEISRTALIETMRQHIKADAVGLAPAVIAHYLVGFEEAADAILNLAPVGGRGEEGSSRADLSPASRSPDQHTAGGEG